MVAFVGKLFIVKIAETMLPCFVRLNIGASPQLASHAPPVETDWISA
eukprot:COSAG05_NODE_311_length_11636_cov_11.922250_4_plen_47_part_00